MKTCHFDLCHSSFCLKSLIKIKSMVINGSIILDNFEKTLCQKAIGTPRKS